MWLAGIYNVDIVNRVIYLQYSTFHYLNRLQRKVVFADLDNREHLVESSQISVSFLNFNNQSFVTLRLLPFFFFTNRVAIEVYSDKILFRDFNTVRFDVIENMQKKEFEFPDAPVLVAGASIELKLTGKARKAVKKL